MNEEERKEQVIIKEEEEEWRAKAETQIQRVKAAFLYVSDQHCLILTAS